MPDRRGSGDNEIQRGHTPSVSQLIDDLTRWTDFARSQWSTARVHLIGISWGGKLAAALAHRLPDRIATLSLVTPGIYAKADISLMDKARVAGSLIFGSSRRFPIPLNDPRLFTDDACWIGFITEDTRRLIDATARLLWASKKLDRRSRRRIPVHIPTQLMLAENDRIVDNRMLSGWFRRQTGDRRRLIIYQAALHTLEFGSAAEQYREDLAEWIKLAETD
jgi:alpha-beta hydrolase superfamily lysophospholipase